MKSCVLWSRLGLSLVAIGMLVRIALYFPPAMYQIDSDAVIAGLCGFRVAEGHFPVFLPGGTRLSAASCYVAAGYFHVFGPGRTSLALTGLTWALLYLVFSLVFFQALLGRKMACLAMVFASVPSEQFMTVTYAPWGYGEIMASCAATLWLATLWRNGGALWQRLALGFSVGLGLWFSLQTLMIAAPAIAWVALKRRGATVDESIPVLLGAIVGAMPLIAGNVAHGFPTLTQNWASRAAPGFAQAWDNFVWLLTYMLPKLLFRSSGWWSETTVLIVAYTLVAIGFVAALTRMPEDPARPYRLRDVGALIALVFAACVILFSASQAGTIRGWTVRYIAPLYTVVPVFCAIGISSWWRATRWIAVTTVAALLIPNLLLYGLPGSALRAQLTAELSNDERLRDVLAQRHVRLVYGNYVWIYHLNFDSRETVAAVPFDAPFDYLDYGDELGSSPVRWALIGGMDEILGWARSVGAHGSITTDGDLLVFIADRPASNAAALLATLRGTRR